MLINGNKSYFKIIFMMEFFIAWCMETLRYQAQFPQYRAVLTIL